jgi:hypothetical protein
MRQGFIIGLRQSLVTGLLSWLVWFAVTNSQPKPAPRPMTGEVFSFGSGGTGGGGGSGGTATATTAQGVSMETGTGISVSNADGVSGNAVADCIEGNVILVDHQMFVCSAINQWQREP